MHGQRSYRFTHDLIYIWITLTMHLKKILNNQMVSDKLKAINDAKSNLANPTFLNYIYPDAKISLSTNYSSTGEGAV